MLRKVTHCAGRVSANAHAFIVIVSSFATCSEHVYSEYFQKISEIIARQGKQATAHTRMRERESLTCGRNSRAKAGKINEAERDSFT